MFKYKPLAAAILALVSIQAFADDSTSNQTQSGVENVADWLKDPDEPGTWEAHYEPFAVDADRAVSVGTSKYFTADGSLENHYHNVFLLRFDGDGRVAEFTEYWRQVPKDES